MTPTVARTIKDVRSAKVRMYLKELEAIRELKVKLARHTTAAKIRRAKLTGGQWAWAEREALNFNLTDYLV